MMFCVFILTVLIICVGTVCFCLVADGDNDAGIYIISSIIGTVCFFVALSLMLDGIEYKEIKHKQKIQAALSTLKVVE